MREQDPKGFQEKINERKTKSVNSLSADQRILRFRNKVRYGPIFVCSCCHQKLFQNQVEEYTDKLKQEIDLKNQDL